MTTDRYTALSSRNFFDEFLQLRDEQREEKAAGQEVMLHYEEIPWELNRQGYMKWYMAPTMTDTALRNYIMYLQRIPPHSRSGKQLSVGHQVGFIWKGGPGYSIIDGERHDWNEWDVLQIPIRHNGIVVQHFNPGDVDIEIMFSSVNTAHSATVDRGPGFEQIEDCPEYVAERNK